MKILTHINVILKSITSKQGGHIVHWNAAPHGKQEIKSKKITNEIVPESVFPIHGIYIYITHQNRVVRLYTEIYCLLDINSEKITNELAPESFFPIHVPHPQLPCTDPSTGQCHLEGCCSSKPWSFPSVSQCQVAVTFRQMGKQAQGWSNDAAGCMHMGIKINSPVLRDSSGMNPRKIKSQMIYSHPMQLNRHLFSPYFRHRSNRIPLAWQMPRRWWNYRLWPGSKKTIFFLRVFTPFLRVFYGIFTGSKKIGSLTYSTSTGFLRVKYGFSVDKYGFYAKNLCFFFGKTKIINKSQ